MKRLAILLVVMACAHRPATQMPSQLTGVMIPGANLDDVRNAVVSQLTSKGYSILIADKNRVVGESPVTSDLSGNYFASRTYFISETSNGVALTGGGRLVDRTPAALRRYDQRRQVIALGIENAFPADLQAISRQFSR